MFESSHFADGTKQPPHTGGCSFVGHGCARLVFSVTKKPRYLPNIKRVCASIEGKALNTIKLGKRNNHWNSKLAYAVREMCAGRGGRSRNVNAPFTKRPKSA